MTFSYPEGVDLILWSLIFPATERSLMTSKKFHATSQRDRLFSNWDKLAIASSSKQQEHPKITTP
jgi:hypothetical protein